MRITTAAKQRRATTKLLSAALLCLGAQSAYACGDQSFLSEVCTFGFNFCPVGWAPTNGQLLPISQNTALFALLGTTYGGNGTTTFALPNLQGRVIVDVGQSPGLPNVIEGESFGAATTTLTANQMPVHSHTFTPTTTNLQMTVNASTAPGTSAIPTNGVNYLGAVNASAGSPLLYTGTNASPVALGGGTATGYTNGTLSAVGGSRPVSTQPPALAFTTCIALQGIFPTQN